MFGKFYTILGYLNLTVHFGPPPRAIYSTELNFSTPTQEDITLKKYRCVLRVACKSSVPSGRFDNMISTRNVQVMDLLCEAEGVPKA